MPETDVFAQDNSGLGRFLFAEIGIEQNGSSLTVLSALARNGYDPWDKAAQWATAPRAKVVNWLAADIIRLPLATGAIDDAHDTAARLVQLLPSPPTSEAKAVQARGVTLPRWGFILLLTGSIMVALAIAAAVSLHPTSLAGSRDDISPAAHPIAAGK